MDEDVRILFSKLVDLSPSEREAFYAQRRVSAAARAELESLLTFDDTAGDSLSGLVGSAAEQLLRSSAPVSEDGRCGPYRLVELIGNGGMGAVYLAERADGELEQRVAIKFLRAGADLPSFRVRFLRERQILASLNHAGIARLLDAGRTRGYPYLVMEYVQGTRIDQYASGLDTRAILELFLRVAEAVSYAHRNLIIHRDLKPSNILIDEAGQPKLLDFGIAKILVDTSEQTRTMDRLLTPEYASPEQIRGEAQATTTDVYSLGAVLYRLLTGQSPHAPVQPVSHRLPKDLEFILGKAMRKEPEERYASVDAFSEDVRAYLEHRPVRARRGNAWYLARIFVRRYWLPVSAAALAVISLSAGLWVANRERAVAQTRFVQVRELAGHLIFDLHDEIRNVPGATGARDKLASTAVQYLDSLAQEARSDPDLAWELLNAYDRLSQTRGGLGGNVGRTEEALKLAEKVVQLAEGLETRGGVDAERLRKLFIVYDGLARMYLDLRRKPEMEKIVGHLLRLAPNLPSFHQAQAFSVAAEYEEVFGSHARALDHAEAAVRIIKNVPQEQPDSVVQMTQGGALLSVGRARARFGLLEEALEGYRAALVFYEAALRVNPQHLLARRNLYLGHVWIADVLASDDRFNLGRLEEAEEHFRAAIALAEQMVASDAKNEVAALDLARAVGKLGSAIHQLRPAESLALMNRAHALLIKTSLGNTSAAEMQLAYLLESVGPLVRLGRIAEAQTNVDTAVPLLAELRGKNPSRDWTGRELDIHMAQSKVFEALGQYPKALATVNEEVALMGSRGSADGSSLGDDYLLVNALERMVRLGLQADRSIAAGAQKRLVQIWSGWSERLPRSTYVADRLKQAQAQLATF